MRRYAHWRQSQRPGGRGENVRPRDVGGDEHARRCDEVICEAGAAGAVRLAAEVAYVDVAEAHAGPPGRRPLDPLLGPTPRRALDVIHLAQPVVDRVRGDTPLEAKRILHAIEPCVPTHPETHDDIRE